MDTHGCRPRIATAFAAFVLSTSAACGGAGNGTTSEDAKIGFILVGARDDLGYNQAVWEGADAVAKRFPDHEVVRVENVPETAVAVDAMEELIDGGVRVVFATSFGHYDAALEVARHHPDVVVVHQGATKTPPGLDNFGTYFGAHYEPVYLAGIAAGTASPTGTLGYVVAFPIPATYNNVNAFTLGAQSVNPAATTQVVFTDDWCGPAAQRKAFEVLAGAGVDVIAQHQDCTRTILELAEATGVRSVGYHADGSEVAPQGWLAGPVWVWGNLYTEIARVALDGTFAGSKFNADVRRGLDTGDDPLVLTELGPSTPPAAAALVEAAEARFRQGATPFSGPIIDREGSERVASGKRLTTSEIDAMDWFVAGVEERSLGPERSSS